MSDKYIRHIGDGDFPDSLFYKWSDRRILYVAIAENIKKALIELLISMSKKYARLAQSVKVKVVNDGVEISMDEYGKYLDLGTRGRYMTSHIGKSIPIETGSGKVIIRKVTSDSIARGRWYNPGIKALNFVEHAIKLAIKKTVEDSYEVA